MTARIKAQLESLSPPVPVRRRPSARELLHALLEAADIESLDDDGNARLVLDVPPALLDELAEWEADAPEPDEDIEAVS